MSDFNETPDPETQEQEQRDAAFLDADAHEVFGVPLNPFSYSRMALCERMGMRLFRLRAGDMDEAGRYDGWMQDVALVLWACASPDIDIKRALRDPDGAAMRAMEWMDQAGARWPNDRFHQATKEFWPIVHEVLIARDFDVRAPAGSQEKNS